MMRKPSRTALGTISLLCLVLLTACSSGSPFLRSVVVSPSSASIDAAINGSNNTQQFTAMGFYSDGTQKDVTSSTSWASSNSAVASIDATGLATAANPPDSTTVTITGSIGGTASTATLSVVHAIQSIAVTPIAPSIALGLTQQFVAKGTYTNIAGASHVEDVSSVATWASSNPASATINASGLATSAFTGAVQGTTNINATIGAIASNNAVLTVTAPVANGLKVSPAGPTLAVGNSSNLTALTLNSDGSTAPLTGAVTWATSACTPVGTVLLASSGVNGNELISGTAAGSCTVTATEGTLTGSTTVTVVTGTTHFAYISNAGGNGPGFSIGGYAVAASAAVPLVPLTPATTATNYYQPTQTILHPNGKYIYVIDGASKVHLYTVNATTGGLTLPTEPNPLPSVGATTLNFGAIDPTGRFFYATDYDGNAVHSAALDATDGHLETVNTITGFTGPEYLAIDHSGKYVYVVDDNDTLYAFNINQADGTLTPNSTPTYALATGSGPMAIAIDPSNKYLYVANNLLNTVSAFTIDAGGALGNPTTLNVASATTPATLSIFRLIVDPSTKYLYVTDAADGNADGGVYGFTIGANGALNATPIAGSPFPVGVSPLGAIVIDPTGTLVAVDNNGNNTSPGSISLFALGTGGVLSPKTPPTVATGDTPYYVTFYNAP